MKIPSSSAPQSWPLRAALRGLLNPVSHHHRGALQGRDLVGLGSQVSRRAGSLALHLRMDLGFPMSRHLGFLMSRHLGSRWETTDRRSPCRAPSRSRTGLAHRSEWMSSTATSATSMVRVRRWSAWRVWRSLEPGRCRSPRASDSSGSVDTQTTTRTASPVTTSRLVGSAGTRWQVVPRRPGSRSP